MIMHKRKKRQGSLNLRIIDLLMTDREVEVRKLAEDNVVKCAANKKKYQELEDQCTGDINKAMDKFVPAYDL